MSSRKSTAATAVVPKVDNPIATITTPTAPIANAPAIGSATEKIEMGASTSSAATAENTTNETSSETIITDVTPTTTNKETPKVDVKQITGENKRITRNSPLPSNAIAIAKKDTRADSGAESEPVHSESDDGTSVGGASTGTDTTLSNFSQAPSSIGSTKKTAPIRGRKPLKEAKEFKEASTIKDKSKEEVEPKKNNEAKGSNEENDYKDIKDTQLEKKSQDVKESNAIKENKSEKDIKETKDIKDVKDIKEVKDSKETTKDAKDKEKEKDIKEQKDVPLASTAVSSTLHSHAANSHIPATTNRLTRKAVAQELAASTRVTRNRQMNAGRPETPPSSNVRSRRPAAKKMAAPVVESLVKRKRSQEEATGEPVPKYIKIEAKIDSDITEEEHLPPPTVQTPTPVDTLKIKQEPIESDDSNMDNTISTNVPTSSVTTVTRGRGRIRGGRRQQISLPVSPSTRATRQSKMSSPSPTALSTPTEPKRRRISIANTCNTVTRSSSVNQLNKTSSTITTNAVIDEDSKDSLISTLDDLLADIKMEKMTPELEETDCESVVTEKAEASTTTANGIEESLTVETDATDTGKNAIKQKNAKIKEATNAIAATNCNATEPEKAASLSPELVSEGISEISVKQFYKKPEFLENNLGIEKDPKLGEIVQKATTEKVTTDKEIEGEVQVTLEDIKREIAAVEKVVADTSSADSIKEGELRVEESADEKNELSNEDDVSLSTDNLSPLVMEEDEDELLKGHEEEATLTKKLTVEDDDIEDDITVEESETASMDNNASLHDYAPEEQDEMEGIEENYPREVETYAKKTKNECDNVKAELNVETKHQEHVKIKTNQVIKVEPDFKSTSEDQETPKSAISLAKKISNQTHTKADIEECIFGTRSKLKDATKVVSAKTSEKLGEYGNDDVLAKIDAELKKIGERLKEKPIVDTKTIPATEEDKENVATLTAERLATDATVESMDVNDDNELKALQIEMARQDSHGASDNLQVDERLMISTDIGKESGSSSDSNSPNKFNHKDDDNHSTKSGQSTDTILWSKIDILYDEESLRKKEQLLQNLGLLTHKAAEKRRKEFIQSSAAAVEASRSNSSQNNSNSSSGSSTSKRNGKPSATATQQEYTGTLKTVIKLNRSSSNNATPTTGTSSGKAGKNQTQTATTACKEMSSGNGVRRQSLKMTFQKGRGRGQGNTDRTADQHTHGEDAYYTIQNENEGAMKTSISGGAEQTTNVHSHGRKSYNRSNNTSHSTNTTNSATIDSSHSEGNDTHIAHTGVSTKKDEKEEILIPEKASSFKFHPGRLCEDQCFYCSGKFGLYDTPCHVGQIKSVERQQKILANEEKLTVDNCLCDACFRHVDRRANVPSYKKRLSASGHLETASPNTSEGLVIEVPEEDAEDRRCLVPDCTNPAAHSLRRKCIRKSVKKFLLNFDMTSSSPNVWLCQIHYETVIQCSGCVLCKRRLGKNHMYHITSDTERLEKSLSEMGIPVQLGIGTAVCKLCRYFANLLMKPPDSNKSQKAEFVKNYRKRLLQFHNIHEGSNDGSEADEEDVTTVSPKKATEQNKSPQKRTKKDSVAAAKTTLKELSSPTGSTGSSVQCLGEANVEASISNATTQQPTLVESDVLVDYDVPMISTDSNSSNSATPPSGDGDKQMSKLKAILQSSSTADSDAKALTADISNVLRSNPNISMRELFPGEEDLGLQFKVPFGSNSSQRTPEGWTRVQTFLQYDEPTRRLWEELQKPYGNQSSFLRHLILLEKYYRNGDLVLSPHASSNASVYTQTVRQRLTSYDEGHCGGLQSSYPTGKGKTVQTVEIAEEDDDDEDDEPLSQIATEKEMDAENGGRSQPAVTQQLRTRSMSVDKLTKQLSSNAVTIIARPKEASKSTDPSPQKSLLKEKEVPSVSGKTLPNLVAANQAASCAVSAAAAHSTTTTASSSNNSRSILKSNLLGINKSIELLPITAAGSSGHSTIVKTTSSNNINTTTTNTESKQQKILDVANKLLGNQLEAAVAAANAQNKPPPAHLLNSPPELVSLHRRASTAGLAPTTSSAAAFNASLIKRPQQPPKPNMTRTVPPNVVILPDTLTPQERLQSKSWRPTLMPVEENQHLLNKNGPLYQTADGRRLPALVQVQSGGKPFLISIFDYNRMCILRREKLLRDQMLKASKTRLDLKQQQLAQKNSAVAAATAAAAANMQNFNKPTNKQQAAQQQLLHLQYMQMQKHQQQAALKAAAAARYQPIAPKSNAAATVASATVSAASSYPAPMMPLLASAITNAAATSANTNPATTSNNASWLWNNFPDANQLLLNGGKMPQLIPKPAGVSGNATKLLLDNSLMSKIPKSLTVIPQHKLMGNNGSSTATSSASASNSHKE